MPPWLVATLLCRAVSAELPAAYPSLAASGSMAAPVRWGILGCGDVCEVKSGPALQRASGSELVAVMRRTPGAAKDFAQRHGVPKWFEDAKALVDCEDVTAVYVASTPAAHYEHAKLAAEVRAPTPPPPTRPAMPDGSVVRAGGQAVLHGEADRAQRRRVGGHRRPLRGGRRPSLRRVLPTRPSPLHPG